MSRSLLWLLLGFGALWVAVTVWRWEGERTPVGSEETASRAEEIQAFWNAYHRATEARTGGDFPAAIDAYREALDVDPDHQDALFYLAICLQETGRYAKASRLLRKSTELYPESSRGWTQLGALLSEHLPGAEPDLHLAMEAFRRAEALNPEHSGPFLGQGLVALQRGELDRARDFFRIAAGTGAPEGVFLSGLAAFLRGEDASAVQSFVKVLEANAREKAITGRGILSEGDIVAGERADLSPGEQAAIQSRAFLAWSARRLGGYPDEVPDSFRTHFEERTVASVFRPGTLAASAASGRGAFVDADGDGRPDLVVASPDGLRLYRNTPAGWVDGTAEAGLDAAGPAWDVHPRDVDQDGWTDLYLLRSGYVGVGANALLLNDEGRFREATEAWNLGGRRAAASVVGADLDGDGRSDLLEVGNATGADPVRLFLHGGDRFLDSTSGLGLDYPGHAVDAAASDVDGDGDLDLVVLGWKSPLRLFRNGPSGFTDATAVSGLAGVGGSALSVVFFDFDRDGDDDLLVGTRVELAYSLRRWVQPGFRNANGSPRLFRNDGHGRFEEVTREVGLDRPFGIVEAIAADFDGDGWPDLLFVLGGPTPAHLEPSVILRNRRGAAFVVEQYLPSRGEPVNACGAAVADVNGDDRPDVFLCGSGLFLNQWSR